MTREEEQKQKGMCVKKKGEEGENEGWGTERSEHKLRCLMGEKRKRINSRRRVMKKHGN